MSKKNKKPAPADAQAAADQSLPAGVPSGARQETKPLDAQAPAQDVSKKHFFIFWSIIILALAGAWILAAILPGVSESVIERRLMVVMAAALGILLFVYK